MKRKSVVLGILSVTALGLLALVAVLTFATSSPRATLPARQLVEPPAAESIAREAEEDETNEYEMLLAMGDYFATRVTYPTGRFDQAWLLDAARQDLRKVRARFQPLSLHP